MNNMTFMELMSKGGWVMWIMFGASILIFCSLLRTLLGFLENRLWKQPFVGTRQAVRAPGTG